MSALAKLGATILTYPILLVKSRLMAASKHTHADLQYNGTYDALKRIYKKEGMLRCYFVPATCVLCRMSLFHSAGHLMLQVVCVFECLF